MWRGYTKIKLHKSIVYKEILPWLGPTEKLFNFGAEVLDWLTRITFIYKKKAVATVLPLIKSFWGKGYMYVSKETPP